jgi:hypothetical protein
MRFSNKTLLKGIVLPGICGVMLLGLRSTPANGGEKSSGEQRVQVAAYYFPNWHEETQPVVHHGEWEGLKNAKPRFPGQPQPVVPLWGYQDEADPAVMAQKIDAAADHGVDAFIFDWYWRSGGEAKGPSLEKALDDGYLKAPNRKRVKFALMWANHNLGPDNPGAIPREVFDRFTDHIVNDYFTSDSYWTIDGRCYFSIYQLQTFIDGMGGVQQAKEALDSLRAKTVAAGRKGIYLNIVDWQLPIPNAKEVLRTLGVDSVTSYVWVHKIDLKDFPKTDYTQEADAYFKYWDDHKDDYGVPYFPNVTKGWDPTPRVPATEPYDGKKYPNTPVLWDNSPKRFKASLEQARERALTLPAGQRVITIYAWNEWTEGGFLEPETMYKMEYLNAIKSVFGVAKHQ